MVRFNKHKRDASGNTIVEKNSNPILDSRMYVLEFPYGRKEDFSENLLNQADLDGSETGQIDEVIDIKKYLSIAVAKEGGTFITASGQERDIVITNGWDVHIHCKDQSTSWIPMAEVKSGNPI